MEYNRRLAIVSSQRAVPDNRKLLNAYLVVDSEREVENRHAYTMIWNHT